MVLVAPRPLLQPAPPGGAAAAADRGTGAEVLALLRGDVAARPRFDPGLAGGLRAWLEDAAYDVVAARGEHAPPLFLGPRQLLGSYEEAGGVDGAQRGDGRGDGLVLSRLVHTLLRQLVHTGEIQDPLGDALDALRAAGDEAEVREIEALPAAARTALTETLSLHAHNLTGLVPRFAPGWMPRTNDRVAIPLAGGRIVLHGVFDLVVGLPQPRTASLCALGLSTGGPWAAARRSLHYLSLLETLRTGTPPFRLALLESASGRYGVEDVREEHLRAIASHIAAWLARVTAVLAVAVAVAAPASMDSRLMDALGGARPRGRRHLMALRPRRGKSEAGRPGRAARRCRPLPRHRSRGAHRLHHRRGPRSRSGAAVCLVLPHGPAIHRGGRSPPDARGLGALPPRGGAEPVGRILPLGTGRQFLRHPTGPLG